MGEATLDGFDEMYTAMQDVMDAVDETTPGILAAGAAELLANAVALLSLTSHAPGTPTPSAPGEPPSMVSGSLAGSLSISDITTDGDGAYVIEVGPTIVYSRIQELGGICGRNYATDLPARPYMLPAVEASVDDIGDMFVEGWADAIDSAL